MIMFQSSGLTSPRLNSYLGCRKVLRVAVLRFRHHSKQLQNGQNGCKLFLSIKKIGVFQCQQLLRLRMRPGGVWAQVYMFTMENVMVRP